MMKAELWSGRVPVRVVQWDGRSEEIYIAEHSLPRVDLDLSPEVSLEPTFRRRIFRRDHSAQGFVFREVV